MTNVERVEKFLRERGYEGDVVVTEESTATVEEAARVVGVEPSRIAKSLSFKLKDGSCLILVSQGMGRVDNKKFKAAFGSKPKMLKADEVEEMTGYQVGGVCPFALKEGVKIYLDVNLKEFDTVFPSAGSAASMIEITPDELLRVCGGEWTDVTSL